MMDTRWKSLRVERGWSQRDVVRRLVAVARRRGEVLPSEESLKKAITRWDNGHSRPSLFYFGLLAEVFELPPDARPVEVHGKKLTEDKLRAELASLRTEMARLTDLVQRLAAVA